jgi:hypothetical protein
VNNIEIPNCYISHKRCTAFVPKQKDSGPVAPESGVLHNNSFDITVFTAEVEPLKGNTIVVAPDEAIGYQYILRVAWVYAVIVLYA